MIVDPPVLRIRRHFPRPSAQLVEAFRGASTGHLVDAMGGAGALDAEVKPLAGVEAEFCGTALTCDAGPADNLALFGALAQSRPGDVILAATRAHRGCAVLGDLLAGMAKNAGVAAIVTDGLARDLAGLESVGLPVQCKGVSANSPSRCGPGTVGEPIVIAGVLAAAGDIVVGDRDGVVIVPLAIAAEVAARLAGIRAAETQLEARVKGGLKGLDSVQALLASDRVVFVD
jgi:4-hydroxy-4-methyl-2-oxoglutarate aldolase